MDARTGLPVVGMVGAGQLARMTHQAAIALGQSLRILADSPDDGAALVAADVVVGDYRSLEDLRAFATGCDVVTFDHEHVPNEHLRALAADGVSVQPGAGALRFAQDKAAMRTRLTALGIPSPRWADCPSPTTRWPGWPSSAPRSAGRSCSRPRAAATTARASGCSTRSPTPRPLLDGGAGPAGRGEGADRPRAGRGGGPLAVRAGRGLAASSRPSSATASASRSSPPRRIWPRTSPTRPSSSRCASRPNSASPACSPSSCSRHVTGGCWSTSWRCARTTPGTGRSRAPAPRSSSSTCGPCSTTRSGRPTLTAPVVVMANLLGGPGRRAAQGHRRARAPLHGALARRQDPPVRQGLAARAQGRARHRARRRPRRPCATRAGAAADYLMNGDAHG